MGYLFNRFREGTSAAGLGLLLTNIMQAYTTHDPVAVGAAAAGVLAILIPEGQPATK